MNLETREQAGEPDGHADPDATNEPPPLPTTPPPAFESRSSFLYSIGGDKPKLPTKPATMLIRKPPQTTNHLIEQPQSPSCTLVTFTSLSGKAKLSKQDSNDSDAGRMSKRRAPMPPQNGDDQENEKEKEQEKVELISSCESPQIEKEMLPKICTDHEIRLV